MVLRFPCGVVEAYPRNLILVLAVNDAMSQDAVDVALRRLSGRGLLDSHSFEMVAGYIGRINATSTVLQCVSTVGCSANNGVRP